MRPIIDLDVFNKVSPEFGRAFPPTKRIGKFRLWWISTETRTNPSLSRVVTARVENPVTGQILLGKLHTSQLSENDNNPEESDDTYSL